MTSTPQTEALEAWLKDNGAFIHPSARILENAAAGVHVRAAEDIPPGTTVATTPHSISLSYLNAIVDDRYPAQYMQRTRMKVEAIGFFYLMTQYLDRERSFWKPYLDSLPGPESELSQPLFFADGDDVAWLAETDVWHTVKKREKTYEEYYRNGILSLEESGISVEPYTWHLFKWAVTMYTSRSFSSRSLRPQSGNHWKAYKTCADGRTREAIVLDMSNTTAGDLHFPVLFPGLDAANHSPDAKVDWTFNQDSFVISLAGTEETSGIDSGKEVFNNYGAKSNGELLIGYGFCLPDNPHDAVGMTLKTPPRSLQDEIRAIHPAYFTQNGEWDSEKGTFYLKKPNITTQTTSGLAQRPQIFAQLPEPLLELLLYLLRNERDLVFQPFPDALRILTDLDGNGRRYLPHISRMIVASLAPKLQKIQSTHPSEEPRNNKQKYTSTYRHGQMEIMEAIISALKGFTRALIYRSPRTQSSGESSLLIPNGPTLLSLPSFISLLASQHLIDVDTFLHGIALSAGTADLATLRQAGWEEDLWVLLISYLCLSKLPDWLGDAFGEYASPFQMFHEQRSEPQDLAEAATDVMDIVRAAAKALPASQWASERWSPTFVARTGGIMVRHESFMVMVPSDLTGYRDGSYVEEREEAGLFIYFHFPIR